MCKKFTVCRDYHELVIIAERGNDTINSQISARFSAEENSECCHGKIWDTTDEKNNMKMKYRKKVHKKMKSHAPSYLNSHLLHFYANFPVHKFLIWLKRRTTLADRRNMRRQNEEEIESSFFLLLHPSDDDDTSRLSS